MAKLGKASVDEEIDSDMLFGSRRERLRRQHNNPTLKPARYTCIDSNLPHMLVAYIKKICDFGAKITLAQ